MKILIIGHARSGKDTLGNVFTEQGLTFDTSSMAAAKIFLFDKLKEEFGYKTIEECYEDRKSPKMRKLWFDSIREYNKGNNARLAKEIIRHNDIYIGMRSYDEFLACKVQNIFDLVVWVDAKSRVPLEQKASMELDEGLADIIIENNGDESTYLSKCKRLVRLMIEKK